MKRLIPLLFTAVLFASCEKEPNLDKVQDNYVVYTQYDKDANFSKGNTFFIADSVLVISDDKKAGATYLDSTTGDYIIDAYTSHMQARGYSRVANKNEAAYGLQISFVESTYYYTKSPSWWSDYPWYWTPSYWWPWYNGIWYHPYPFIYSYNAGSIVGEMVDITAITPTTATSKPTIIWNSYITDIGDITPKNESKVANAIGQAFTQSPYLKYQ